MSFGSLNAIFAEASAPEKLRHHSLDTPQIFTEDESHQLLDWLLYETRGVLQRTLEENPKDAANAFREVADITTAPLHGRCTFSQSVAAYALKDRGFNPNNFCVQSIKECTIGHASLTVLIEEDTGPQLYMIDPTYRQFYDQEHPHNEEKNIPMPGFVLEKTQVGKNLLENLITKGYARITPEEADAYLSAFCNGISPFNTKDESFEFLKSPPRDEMEYHMDKGILGKLNYLIPSGNK